jgi:hypothetical protein
MKKNKITRQGLSPQSLHPELVQVLEKMTMASQKW